jgi:hypothetical protein
MMRRRTFKLTEAHAKHFVALDPETFQPVLTDQDGTILVFTDRRKAEAAVLKLHPDTMVCTIGMGDERWALFKLALFERGQKYRAVE